MVLLYIMQQRDILYYQLRVFNENTDNTIEVDAIKGSEEGTVDDDECFFAFSKAVESIGLPMSPTLAFPASTTHPFPSTWIWLARLKEMQKGKCTDQLNNFANGEVMITLDQEERSWKSIVCHLKQSMTWYEDYVSTSVDPSDLVLVQIIHTNAKKILGQSLKLAEGKVEEILVQKNTYDA